MLQEARSLGLTASDDDLANHLAQSAGVSNRRPVSTKNAIYSFSKPIDLLPAQFEEEQREQLTIQRLYSVILDAVHVTDAEVRERYRIEQEKINLQLFKLPVSDFIAEVKTHRRRYQEIL